MALEAPPVPSIKAFLCCGSNSGSIDWVNPRISELYPISLIFPLAGRMILITFTAPMAAASGSNSSK